MTIDAARLRDAFEENFANFGEIGAAVSVWQNGEPVIDLFAGYRDLALRDPWTEDTLVLIWSATKGLAAACVVHAMEARGVQLNDPVATSWPEFAANGKETITFGQVLSHQAGLAAVDAGGPFVLAYDEMIHAIEEQAPNWSPSDGHGYGARTFGFLTDEITRRLSEIPLGDYWRREFADPLDLDVWIGLPESHHHRVAQMIAARPGGCRENEDAFEQALTDATSLTRRAFATGGILGATTMNSPAIREASLPALGGIATARGLAKFYAMLANGGTLDGKTFFTPDAVARMQRPLTQGLDRVLRIPTAFSTGFMLDPVEPNGTKSRSLFGPNPTAFGHPGAGGSLAFADPTSKLSFAYIMNQMGTGILPGQRAQNLVATLN